MAAAVIIHMKVIIMKVIIMKVIHAIMKVIIITKRVMYAIAFKYTFDLKTCTESNRVAQRFTENLLREPLCLYALVAKP